MAEDYNPQEELDKAIGESEEEEIDLTDIEKLIQDRFGNGEEKEESGPSETAPPAEGESETATDSPSDSPPEPTTPTEDVWEFDGGLKLDKETAQSLAEFNAFLNENPEVAEAIRETIANKYQPPTDTTTPPPAEPTLSADDLDLADPNVKFLYDNYQKQQSDLQSAMDIIRRHELQLNTQTEATANSIVERAVTSFQDQHQLDDESMDKIRAIAGQMNIIESVFAPVDPITQLPRKVDPLTAIEKSLDIAYWSIPEYREKEITRQLEVNRKDQEKKRKLTSLGGSSGSVPREQQTPTTKEEIQAAMIREVAQAMGTTPSI